jgi:hypothetical protein
MDYFYKMYFQSKTLELKKYYLDLYLKSYFKKIKEDTTNNLTEYFTREVSNYDLKIDRIIYDFETKLFNFTYNKNQNVLTYKI